MNLSFNNLDELQEFLDWSLRYGAAWAATQRGPRAPAPETPYPAIDPSALPEAGAAGGVAFDTPPGAPLQGAVDDKPAEAPAANEPTKRKRRTKAEIEADEKAAAAAAAEAAKGTGSVDIARVEHADGTVTTTSVGLPPDVHPSEVTTSPTGANPFEQAATAPATDGEPDADATVVTPLQHITRARAFIAKHQIAKYNETFAKAGTDPNVMAYTAEQRAAHMAAMDELDKA